VNLQNVLPYIGIDEVLRLYIIESTIPASSAYYYTVGIYNATRPLKATLVWNDPTNTILTSTKMLLNNLDLRVLSMVTGEVYYGNNIAGDEYNNVSVSMLTHTRTQKTAKLYIIIYYISLFICFFVLLGGASLDRNPTFWELPYICYFGLPNHLDPEFQFGCDWG
jgi:hypothetical protein